MEIVCSDCGQRLSDGVGVCPVCEGTSKGFRYGEDDLADGRIQAPEGFFNIRDESPDWYRWSAWLWADDEHPAGEGQHAYRVVYKTIRMPIVGTLRLNWPNLNIRMWHGSVRIGHPTVDPSNPGRKEGYLIVPEWGLVVDTDDGAVYQPTRASSPSLGAEDDELTDGSFVEFILRTESDRPNEQIAEGRRTLASLHTMIDLSFGRRLLGTPLSEEVGELFDDGHFNCSVQSSLVGMESLTTVELLPVQQLQGWAQHVLERHMRRPTAEKETLALASEWYRLAESSLDPVLEFVYIWLSIEVLAMPNTTNIRPVRELLPTGLGGSEQDWKQLVGRLYGTRSDIIHAGRREVPADAVGVLRDIVEVLFELDLGWVDNERRGRLIAARETSDS